MRMLTDDVPGRELVSAGLAALKRGELTVEALLVAVGAPRLAALGHDIPDAPNIPEHPELALYQAIGQAHPEDAHARYNAMIRRLVSYQRELERRRFSGPTG